MISIRSSALALLAVAAGLGLASCLNRLNVTNDEAARLDADEGLVFGHIEVAAPDDAPDWVPISNGLLDTGDGAIVQVERDADGSSSGGGGEWRFRIPPNGDFAWALPEGSYRIVHWRGMLNDGALEATEARLDLEVGFVVKRGEATGAGSIRFDGRALTVDSADDARLQAIRDAVPAFPGSIQSRPAKAISVSPPVRFLKYAKPGGGDGDGGGSCGGVGAGDCHFCRAPAARTDVTS